MPRHASITRIPPPIVAHSRRPIDDPRPPDIDHLLQLLTSSQLGTGRNRALAALTSKPLDLLVVGGGISGAQVAREAAKHGLSVGLIDEGMFGSGTSGQVHFVGGALPGLVHAVSSARSPARLARAVQNLWSDRREASRIASTAPDLVVPTQMEIPVTSRSEYRRLKAAFALCAKAAPEMGAAKWISRAELETDPVYTVVRPDLLGVFQVPELLIDGAGLAKAHARSAASLGAHVAPHVTAIEVLSREGQVVGVLARDAGDSSGKPYRIEAKETLFAGGSGNDAVTAPLNAQLEISGQLLGASFAAPFPGGEGVLYAVAIGNRRAPDPEQRYLVGVAGAQAGSVDETALLGALNQILGWGAQGIEEEDLLAVRPAQQREPAPARRRGDGEVQRVSPGLVQMDRVGPSSARRVAEDMAGWLTEGSEQHPSPATPFRKESLVGRGELTPHAVRLATIRVGGLSLEWARLLESRYGPGAVEVAQLVAQDSQSLALNETLSTSASYLRAEVMHAALANDARTVDEVCSLLPGLEVSDEISSLLAHAQSS